jgi:lipopolysaccharide export system protein LptA
MKTLIAAAALMLVTACAWAERADSLKPVEMKYHTADLDQVTQTYILTGEVVVTRGTLILKSDKALLKETPEGYLSVTLTSGPGGVASFRQKRDGGPDLWVEGQAQRIEYDERAEVVKLFGSAVVKQLEGAKLSSEADGEFISYDNRKEFATVRNDASGEDKPGKGRGTMILAPRRTLPASAPAATPAATPATAPAAPAPGKK